jgi:hypothetical protein
MGVVITTEAAVMVISRRGMGVGDKAGGGVR